jgi:hypothetical protein
VNWLRRFFNREPEYEVHKAEIPMSTIVRWYLYDTELYNPIKLAELIGLSSISEEGDAKEHDDSESRLNDISDYLPFLMQMAEISSDVLTTIQLKEISESEYLSEMAEDMPTEVMQSLFKAVALSTLVGTFSIANRLQIINGGAAPSGFISAEGTNE